MSKFQGKNDLKTKKLFYERLKYSVDAYAAAPDAPFPATIKDFNFAERTLYGRINKAHIPILVNPSNIRVTKSKDDPRKQMRNLHFVADALAAFVADFQKAAVAGKIDRTDPYLSEITIKHSYIDPIRGFREYTDSIIEKFINMYATDRVRNSVRDFSSFAPIFSKFLLEMSKVTPITFSSFITSGHCGLLNTGLAAHVADLDASNDEDKGNFIASSNFDFYKLVAENHGFSISKYAPWILVADIASPPMSKYASRYGLRDEGMILRGCYQDAYVADISHFRRLALKTYRALVARSPRNTKVDGLGRREYFCRAPLSEQEFDSKYPDEFWVDLYIDIRYNEQARPGSMARMAEIKKDAADIQGVSGTATMLAYVNRSMAKYDNYKGSYARRVGKEQTKFTGIKTKPTY